MELFLLFISFIKIGMLSIGGGYASLPVIQMEVVTNNKWITETEFADLIAISQMTPGPIAINAATFVGTKLYGLEGAIVATLGSILPSFIIVLTLSYFYYKYKKLVYVEGALLSLRPTIIALIASSGITILLYVLFKSNIDFKNTNIISLIIFAVGLFTIQKFKISPILMMIGSGIAYYITHLIII